MADNTKSYLAEMKDTINIISLISNYLSISLLRTLIQYTDFFLYKQKKKGRHQIKMTIRFCFNIYNYNHTLTSRGQNILGGGPSFGAPTIYMQTSFHLSSKRSNLSDIVLNFLGQKTWLRIMLPSLFIASNNYNKYCASSLCFLKMKK